MTDPLDALLEQATRQRDEARLALLRAEETARRLQRQAELLHGYRAEYHDRGPTRQGRSSPIELLHCHRAFMQRIDQAVLQQQGQVQAGEAHAARLRAALLVQEQRVASVRKLLERRADERRRKAERLEQRRSDDASAVKRHWRRNPEHA